MSLATQRQLTAPTEAALLQLLFNLASPQTAQYMGHARRPDNTYRVVVQVPGGVRILTIAAPVLSLIADGILVEQDRAHVMSQLA